MAYIVETTEHTEVHENRYYKGKGFKESMRLLAIVRAKELLPTEQDVTVGSFGIIALDGREIVMGWGVSGQRKDHRHGFVGEPGSYNSYTHDLFDSMFKGWK